MDSQSRVVGQLQHLETVYGIVTLEHSRWNNLLKDTVDGTVTIKHSRWGSRWDSQDRTERIEHSRWDSYIRRQMTIVEDSRWDSHNRRQQTGQLRCLCYKTADRTQQMGQLR